MLGSKILVVDDDQFILKSLRELLSGEGLTVLTAPNTEIGSDFMKNENPDLVILDINLPGENGISFCRRVRQKSRIPIIMLTSKADVVDKIVGLEVGADDYLAKPFEPRELLARVRALLRRVSEYSSDPAAKDEEYSAGDLLLNASQLKIEIHGENVELTLLEFRLLEYLMQNYGNVLSRDQIFEHVWGYDQSFSQNSLEVMIYRVRSKVEKRLGSRLIHTVRGYGYRAEIRSGS